MTLWHITKRINVESIFFKGIMAGYRAGIATSPWRKDASVKRYIFLTDDPEYILNKQCGPEWCKRNFPVCLEVIVDGLLITKRCEKEYVTSDPILPNRIKLKREGNFSFVNYNKK